MEAKEEKRHVAGSRVKMLGKGRKMGKAEMIECEVKVGDIVLAIEPDSEMRLNAEDGMYWTVYEAKVTRVSRFTGIRTKKTAHNYLRADGLWSNSDDEEQ